MRKVYQYVYLTFRGVYNNFFTDIEDNEKTLCQYGFMFCSEETCLLFLDKFLIKRRIT